MKCRELRTRYLVFGGMEKVDPHLLTRAIARYSPPESRIKVVESKGGYAIVRLDQKALKAIQSSLGKKIEIEVGGGRTTSIVATGTIKKAKEKIKANLDN